VPDGRQGNTRQSLAQGGARQRASMHATERFTGEPAYCTDFSAGGPKKAALRDETVL
jgi:hypothetical protein